MDSSLLRCGCAARSDRSGETGMLPITRIYKIIDGRKVIESHGTREMPIWEAYNMTHPMIPMGSFARGS
jgi:hypothetical protein